MKKLLIISLLFLSACASRQLPLKGEMTASTTPLKMQVSSEIIPDYSDEYNILMQINFESDDGRWVRIDTADLDLENTDGAPYNVIIGKDLVTWAEAKAEEKKMKDHNASMKSLGFFAASGAMIVAGALSQSDELVAAGYLTYVGTAAYETSKGYTQRRAMAQGVKWVPDSHLMSPFTVPSKTLIKRWVLINAPTGRIAKNIRLNLKTIEGERYTYNIPLVK